MASETVERRVEGAPQEAFNALKAALADLGYKLWKERPVAYLLMAKGRAGGADVEINTRCSMIAPTTVGVTATGNLTGDELKALGTAVLDRLEERLA